MLVIKLRNYSIALLCNFSILVGGNAIAADDLQFNTDVLDVKDRGNIDLSRFSRTGYIMPGEYTMTVHVNKSDLPDEPISFYSPESAPETSLACLSPELVSKLGMKENMISSLRWDQDGKCLDITALPGTEVRGDLSSASLYLNIPQAYLEYSAENWEPPSRWDEGIPGLIFDYNLNAQTQRQERSGTSSQNLSGFGVAGANLGAWRMRSDWQTNVTRNNGGDSQNDFTWTRYYLYRALPFIRAQLTLGEDYLASDIFDSLRFAGASLVSDDQMLPPNLRGYAPEVTGVAKTNARVIVSQQGRIIYETQVAAGPFRIQDLNTAISGELDVKVEEQDGTVSNFTVNSANIPYLTRPGMVRYKLAGGRPTDYGHSVNGPAFTSGEFSWGVTNGWSLYGGGLAGGDYAAVSAGIGRDLLSFGALSADVTQSRATIPQEGSLTGGSYRLSYSKRFDEYDSQVTFAGYRFSQADFLSFREYLDAKDGENRTGKSKELYTVSFNKQFRELGFSTYLNYSYQSYWDRATSQRYNLMLSRYVDVGKFKNISLSASAYRTKYQNTEDDGVYFSVSVPWGTNKTVSYNATLNREDNIHRVAYNERIDANNNYQVSSGFSRHGPTFSGFYTNRNDFAEVNVNATHETGRYSATGISAQGGATITQNGALLHRSVTPGGARLLLDTDGVPDVPVRGYGNTVKTNRYGKAIVTEVNNYYRNVASIDVNNLNDKTEAITSVVQATLTEGAIGYRKFNVIAGEKAMANIRLADGTTPPFGAIVKNSRNQDAGIINDDGSVYLSGINAGESMTVNWNGAEQCKINVPRTLNAANLMSQLLLPCMK
jgi:outer membrane usher protein FimD/PapC